MIANVMGLNSDTAKNREKFNVLCALTNRDFTIALVRESEAPTNNNFRTVDWITKKLACDRWFNSHVNTFFIEIFIPDSREFLV